MKKKVLFTVAALVASAPCFALHDLYGFYVNPSIGYDHLNLGRVSINQNNYNTNTQLSNDDAQSNGLGYSVAAGYGLENLPVRFEIEAASQQNINYNANPLLAGVDTTEQNFSSKVSSYHVMANAIFDFHLNETVLPYIKVGAGIARNQSKLTDSYPDQTFGSTATITQNVTTTKTNFAWQVGAGSAFKVKDNLYINGELSYTDLGKVEWNNFYNPLPTTSTANNISLQSKSLTSYKASVGVMWFFGGSRYTAPAGKMA